MTARRPSWATVVALGAQTRQGGQIAELLQHSGWTALVHPERQYIRNVRHNRWSAGAIK
jgi:hypothetical protein